MARNGKGLTKGERRGRSFWEMLLSEWMSNALNRLTSQELSLVRLYMELTGASEVGARSVFMHVCCREGPDAPVPDECSAYALPRAEPVRDLLVRDFADAGGWLNHLDAVAVPG
jgi:hypothetical protein